MQCEVAEESVVAKKFRPMKAGNRLEDKTGMTCDSSLQGAIRAKSLIACEGRKSIRKYSEDVKNTYKEHKLSDETGHSVGGKQ